MWRVPVILTRATLAAALLAIGGGAQADPNRPDSLADLNRARQDLQNTMDQVRNLLNQTDTPLPPLPPVPPQPAPDPPTDPPAGSEADEADQDRNGCIDETEAWEWELKSGSRYQGPLGFCDEDGMLFGG